MRFCKVCKKIVPYRKNNTRSVCDACQKFFRRYGPRRFSVPCKSGNLDCIIAFPTRQCCLRCRVEKCVSTGMHSKYLECGTPSPCRNIEDANSEEPTEIQECNIIEDQAMNTYFPIVRDPTLYDGTAAETVLRAALKSSTILHNYEFLYLFDKSRPSVTDWNAVAAGTLRHVTEAIQTSLSYGKFFFEELNLSDDMLHGVKPGYVLQLARLYLALPNCRIKSFCLIDANSLVTTKHVFPEVQEIFETEHELVKHMTTWDPNYIICALLFAILLYNERAATIPQLAKIRSVLLLALKLYASKLSNGNNESAQIEINNVNQAIFKTYKCAVTSTKSLTTIVSRFPSFLPTMSLSSPYI